MPTGGPYFIVEHAQTILAIMRVLFGLLLFFALCLLIRELNRRRFASNLGTVWGGYMTDIPDSRDSESDSEHPACIVVPCPTCKANRQELCKTLNGLEMRLVHDLRRIKYVRFIQAHRSPT